MFTMNVKQHNKNYNRIQQNICIEFAKMLFSAAKGCGFPITLDGMSKKHSYSQGNYSRSVECLLVVSSVMYTFIEIVYILDFEDFALIHVFCL